MASTRRVLPLLATGLAALAAGGLGGQPPAAAPVFDERIEITAVTVPVRATAGGRAVSALAASDLEVLEDGQPVPVLSVERVPVAPPGASGAAPSAPSLAPAGPAPAARPWRVLVYVDLQLAGVSSVRAAAWQLGGSAEALAALGEVEVWIADDQAQRVFGPGRDVAGLRKALRKTTAGHFGQRRIGRLRQHFAADSQRGGGLAPRRGGPAASSGDQALVRAHAVEEVRTIEKRRALLERVLAERAVPDWPQAAFVVTGGFDLDPGEFYLPQVAARAGEEGDEQRLAADFRRWNQAEPTQKSAKELAALGWTVVPVLPYDQDGLFAGSAQFHGAAWSGMGAGSGAGTAPAFLLLHPRDPWRMVSEATGGELVEDVRILDDAIARLGERWLVTYQVSRRRDGALHDLEVRARRPGLELEAPEYVSSGAPEAVAAAHARALLDGREERGDLPLSVRLRAEPGEVRKELRAHLEATVEFAPLGAARAGLTATTLRFTIAVLRPDGTVMLIHETAQRADLARNAGWVYEARLVAPPGTERLAVVAEELGTGAWGGAAARWPD